jgi:hypothetical protein
MPYYRVSYDGYIEDTFDDKDQAAEAFVNSIGDIEDLINEVSVQRFDEELERWESE